VAVQGGSSKMARVIRAACARAALVGLERTIKGLI